MKKIVGKLKRFIAMFLVGIMLSSSVFYSYSVSVQAASFFPVAHTIIESLMTLFGYSLGFGKSTDGMSTVLTPDTFSSAIDSSFNGGGVQLGGYGIVDFSDEVAVFEFLKKAYQYTTMTMACEAYDKLLAGYDYLSYKNSGVSSTKTLNNYLGNIVSKYEAEGLSAFKEDMSLAFSIVYGDGASANNAEFTPLAWQLSAAIMSGLVAVGSMPVLEDGTVDESVLSVPGTSEYVEYSKEQLVGDYFAELVLDPEGNMYASGSAGDIVYTAVGKRVCFMNYPPYGIMLHLSNGYMITERDGWEPGMLEVGEGLATSSILEKIMSGSVPVFTNTMAVQQFIESGDYSSASNYLENTTIPVFYEVTPTSTLPEYIVNFMTKTPSVADVSCLASALDELPADVIGTSQYIPTVESVIQTTIDSIPSVDVEPTAAPVVVPGEITGELTDEQLGSLVDSSSTYGGILGKLLNSILGLPMGIYNVFVGVFNLILSGITGLPSELWKLLSAPFATIIYSLDTLVDIFPNTMTNLKDLITILPVSIYEYFADGLTDIRDGLGSLVDVFPGSLADILAGVLGIPATLWGLLEGAITDIAVNVRAIADATTVPEVEPDDDSHSFDFLNLLNGLWLLIAILIVLLSIFLHLMIFIVNIFKIPATTGYLNEDMVLGLNYIKTLEITGIGLSVYDFMMGLVYILMIFGVVKVLRANINRIKIPKSMRGGLLS